jgi:hypothetical protein
MRLTRVFTVIPQPDEGVKGTIMLGRSRRNIRKTIILFYKLNHFEVWRKIFHNTKMAQLTKEIEEAVKKLLDLFPELSSINVFFSKFTYSF